MRQTFYIVTPAYNACEFIDDAIMGVITQVGDFTIHYHVQDGGSADGTIEKLKEWERILSQPNPLVRCNKLVFTWKSEPDFGMYQAINRGFASLNVPDDGIMAWTNTDDHYIPHAFSTVANVFADIPDLRWMGGAILGNMHGRLAAVDSMQPFPQELVRAGCCDTRCWRHLDQASMFWKGSLWKQAGPLKEDLRYAGDYELWPRFAQHTDFAYLPTPLCLYALRPGKQLSAQFDDAGDSLYEMERDRVRPLEDRLRAARAFWKRRLLPPRGPSLSFDDGQYKVIQARAWPFWGQGFTFCTYRTRYYARHYGRQVRAWLERRSPFARRFFAIRQLAPYFRTAPKRGIDYRSFLLYLLSGSANHCPLPFFDAAYYTKVHWASLGQDPLMFHIRQGARDLDSPHPSLCAPYYALKNRLAKFTGNDILLHSHETGNAPLPLNFHQKPMASAEFSVKDFQQVSGKEAAPKRGIPIFTSIGPKRMTAQQEAIATWTAQGFEPVAVNYPDEIDHLSASFPSVTFLPALRDSRPILDRPRIFISDLLDYATCYAKEQGHTFVGIVNSDVSLYALRYEVLQSAAQKGMVFSRRVDVATHTHATGDVYDLGYDAFFFNPVVLPSLPVTTHALGEPFWDVLLPMWSLLHAIPTATATPLCFHVRHSAQWSWASYFALGRETYNTLLTPLLAHMPEDEGFAGTVKELGIKISGNSLPYHKMAALLYKDILNTIPEQLDAVMRNNT